MKTGWACLRSSVSLWCAHNIGGGNGEENQWISQQMAWVAMQPEQYIIMQLPFKSPLLEKHSKDPLGSWRCQKKGWGKGCSKSFPIPQYNKFQGRKGGYLSEKRREQ